MLNEHVAGEGSGYLLVIEYYVLRHLLAIILCLKCLVPAEDGKSIKFPRKHAILADCTTMDPDARTLAGIVPMEQFHKLQKKGTKSMHMSIQLRNDGESFTPLATSSCQVTLSIPRLRAWPAVPWP